MHSDVALYPAFEGEYSGTGRPAKYGENLHVRQLDPKYFKETSTEDHLRTEIYQGQFYNKEFEFLLNPDAILLADIFQQIAHLGAIHSVFQPSAAP